MRWLPALLVLLASFVAAAAPPAASDLQRAKAHYEAGSGLYQLGRYDEAMREFSAGYALSHRPQFALNIAQCYRMLGRYEDARDMIRRFLDEAPADAPERPSATRLLAETEERIRAHGAATPPVLEPPPATTAPSPPIVVTTPAPPTTLTTPAPPPRKSHRAAYIALGVTGAVLVVGAALAIGLVVALPTETVPTTGLGAVRFGP